MLWLVIFTALFLLCVLIAAVFLILSANKKSTKKPTAKAETKSVSREKFSTDLDKMIQAAKDTNLSPTELDELIKLFVKTHKLGSNTSKKLDEKTKHKLEFVSALASNSSASVANISFLNTELKKISNSFRKEIDAYEQMGLAKRKVRA